MAEFLVDKGYTVYLSEWHPILRYGIPHDWCGVLAHPEQLSSPQAWGNLLAFREDPGIGAVRQAFKSCLKVRRQDALAVRAKEGQVEKRAERGRVHSRSLPKGGQKTAPYASDNESPIENTRDGASTAIALSTDEVEDTSQPASSAKRRQVSAKRRLESPSLIGYVRWCLSLVRHRPFVSSAAIAVLAALVAGAFWAELSTTRLLFWNLIQWALFVAVLATGIGYIGWSTRRASRMVDAELKQIAAKTASELRRDRKKANSRRQELAQEMANVRSELTTLGKIYGVIEEITGSFGDRQDLLQKELASLREVTSSLGEDQDELRKQLSAPTSRATTG
jgi:hypothetical protein